MSLSKLSDIKLCEGMRKSFENAEALLNEAHILGNSQKYPRAYTLCQIAIEELAKLPLLFELLMERFDNTKIDYSAFDKRFKDHIQKIETSIEWKIFMFEFFKYQTGKNFVDLAIEKSKESLKEIKKINERKNDSLYVSIKDNEFQSPSEIITESDFNSIRAIAALRKIQLQVFSKLTQENLDELKK